MKDNKNKHQNYEILNLIGYGLAKFDNDFIQEFGFSTKTSFFNYCVKIGLADTTGVIKNRMDLFDHFFPNHRKGWWQKGDMYIHRKILIDNLFGNENVSEFANVVKVALQNKHFISNYQNKIKPITISKYRNLQSTGLEAELFFMNNFQMVDFFKDGIIEDARLYGDGYDFQISTFQNTFLAEVKGIRENTGAFRLTEKEYQRAEEYKENYIINVVLDLNNKPYLVSIPNPLNNLKFKEVEVKSISRREYHLIGKI